MGKYKRIRAKYDGFCHGCKTRFMTGTLIWWGREKEAQIGKSYHLQCRPSFTKSEIKSQKQREEQSKRQQRIREASLKKTNGEFIRAHERAKAKLMKGIPVPDKNWRELNEEERWRRDHFVQDIQDPNK